MRKTKIIATLGPVSASREVVAALIDAGVNAFRLNCSHGTQSEHEECLGIVRDVSGERGAFVAVLQDLPGPKIRVGRLKAPVKLEAGGEVRLTAGGS